MLDTPLWFRCGVVGRHRRSSGHRVGRSSSGPRVVALPGRVEGDVVEVADIFTTRGGRLVRADGYPPHRDRFEHAGYDLVRLLGDSCTALLMTWRSDGGADRARLRSRCCTHHLGLAPAREGCHGRQGKPDQARTRPGSAQSGGTQRCDPHTALRLVCWSCHPCRHAGFRHLVVLRGGDRLRPARRLRTRGPGANRQRKRRQELRDLWPDVVDNLASGVRAGMSLPEALTQLGARGPEALRPAFQRFGEDYRATGRFDACLDRLKAQLADPVADRIVESLRVAREVGAPVSAGSCARCLRSCARTPEQGPSSRLGRVGR